MFIFQMSLTIAHFNDIMNIKTQTLFNNIPCNPPSLTTRVAARPRIAVAALLAAVGCRSAAAATGAYQASAQLDPRKI